MSASQSRRHSALAVALVACMLCLAVFSSMPVKANVLSTIESECASLGATQYQIAFVTSDGTTATSTNIQDYNNFVTAEAASGSSYLSDFVPAGTTWRAIASTTSVNAINNAPTFANVPIFNTTGQLVASGSGQLWQVEPLTNAIEYNETGSLTAQDRVWTGSSAVGTADTGVPGLYAGGALGQYSFIAKYTEYAEPELGDPFSTTGGNLIDYGCYFNSLLNVQEAASYPLYALSSPISVPEPSTLALLGSALLGLGVVYLRRRGAKA